MPARSFANVKDFEKWFSKDDVLILDGTEQRPGDNEVQKEAYSGKKKSHTVKCLIITNPKKLIRYISRSYFGKMHDFGMMRAEFPSSKQWFLNFKIRLDLGFIGFETHYNCKELYLPNKKLRKQELTEAQKAENKE